ncbi:stage III sporulation protein AF [Alkaliphilus peptidifermentans]|uniref:Stage III sporulation protein AF n=1 Tax=Alkaliphilus peptidifermentans DSM 18978 TaxID=1120976 RepID=A0A1G5KDI2_9FIRM|nr:stage III sporulation protein AF [Alkaliphilus peptidifermentans]SCY98626.1 stage III sporulation protein AF [Alkaliphilus peptidifermentans DSM 18978]
MNFLREWITTILSVIIFVTFVEILLPNSNNRKYINVIIGLLVMLVILKPVMGVLNQGLTIGDGILKNTNEIELMTMQNRVSNIQYNQNESIILIYKNDLKEQMKGRIEKQLGYSVYDIEIEIEEETNENFGVIKGIAIIVKEESTEAPKDGIQEVVVNVAISQENNNKINRKSIMLDNGGEEIKKDFSQFYQVAEEDIIVSVLKNN